MAKQIELPSGEAVLVDDEDFDELSQWKWYKICGKRTLYSCRSTPNDDQGKSHMIRMHRYILDAPPDSEVDHIDGNGLNNQRGNLRLATRSENMRNKRKAKNNACGYKGVHWNKRAKKWHAQIGLGGSVRYLGIFTDILEAAQAYDEAARKEFGEFARINFPASGERQA